MFISETQLKFLNNTIKINIDCTFKSSTKLYYQIMNILIKPKNSKTIILILNILTTNKSIYIYLNIFNDIKLLIKIYKLKINWK